MLRLTFHGAAHTVTGSKYLLETDDAKVLIDCGLFQGQKELRLRNWKRLPFDPGDVDAVVLTHAHIDHIGYLPRFVRDGFSRKVYASSGTIDLAELLLYDAAYNQERDAEYANRKGISKHHPALPLFNTHDVSGALRHLHAVSREHWRQAAGSIWFRLHDAGHLLGSCMIEIEVRAPNRTWRLLFSGDLGRYDAPLYHDPKAPVDCDFLVCESTYGDREHSDLNILDELERVVTDSIRRGGVMLVSSFAVGRAQQLIYLLRVLMSQDRIPILPVYLDSPMAVNATEIYCNHAEDHDLSETASESKSCELYGPNIHLARTVAESKRINDVEGPAVIISSSGMMTGGRILFHLKRRLPEARNSVVLGGFMARGTRARALQEGAPTLRIHGRDIPVRAHVESLSALSGHAGRSELLRWLAPLKPPKLTFLTHGEPGGSESLAKTLREDRQWKVEIPKLGDSFDLENL